MRRLSVFARKPPAEKPVTLDTEVAKAPTNLSHFLHLQKVNYLKAVEQGQSRQWTMVMGNESGDLDSLASSIAYAWHATTARQALTIPLIQTSQADMSLRAENLHALSLAGINPSKDLLYSDELPPFPTDKYALVDHNRLGRRFIEASPNARVVAVIDHHEDEGLYTQSADPRMIVVPTGSCSSLVTRILSQASPDNLPAELAKLLLCAILIDTNGLKSGGKAETIDRESAARLAVRSKIADAHSPTKSVFAMSTSSRPTSPPQESSLQDLSVIQHLTAALQTKKNSVAHLSTRDLLRRDYKEYTWTPSWATSSTIQVGLASVPRSLKVWGPSESGFWSAIHGWVEERNLIVLGILTSFRDDSKIGSTKGKGKREMLWFIHEGDAELTSRLWKGLEQSKELKVKSVDLRKYGGDGIPEGFAVRLYKQGNADATRKVTAPLVRSIIEGNETK